MRKITKRSAAVIAGAALALTGGTAAFAIASGWFSGNGTVYAQTSSIQPVTTTIDTRTVANLYPGKSVPVTGNVTNPNDFPVKVTGVTVKSVSSGVNGCGTNEAALSFTDFPTAGPVVVQPGATTGYALGKLLMGAGASPNCAGATLTITATMAGEINS